MSISYTGTTIGTLTLCQPVREKQSGKYVVKKDEKGRTVYNTFRIQIRQSNCLMCAVHVWKDPNPENPKLPWHHDLVGFSVDEAHLKRCLKNSKGFESLFFGKLRNIKLNIYYKEMQVLAKHMTRDGLKVTCYYKPPKS